MLDALFDFFASLKLAVIVLLGFAASLATGTILESQYDTATAQYYVYRSPWFFGLLGLLGVNIFFAAMSRYPWKGRHTPFILAHIGGGGDYRHTYHAVAALPNVYLDLSGSGVDRGTLDGALEAVGARRLLWACDVTMETGLAKLRAIEGMGLSADDVAAVRWRNAVSIFPAVAFGLAS